ncbi:ADP-ribosyltransferase [Methylobacterium sp. ARG-1]|uniref:ADP-ribosyltransferase n=1 Tax=Methylobacterium sp. ARG-1 TaxID=1692501 RepID=UPI000682F7C9|nr:ADP-ribosyltransferase [Methylobacterium sp. ARG-1]KNY20370.1 hypothetical protein AKJ13_22325 [Methylobacterium sp. ARG-1]
MRKPKATKPGAASGGKFDSAKHPRAMGGRFGSKGGAGETSPKKLTVGAERLKTSGVTAQDKIVVLSGRVRKYQGHDTVESFVASHPKGRAHALRLLAADHKAGRIGFGDAQKAADTAKASAAAKYDETKFSDFSNTDNATVQEVERDLYRAMIQKPETPDEIAAINNYSGASFSEINGFLRKRAAAKDRSNPYKEEDLGPEIRNLDRVLKRSKMTEDTVVYRGMSGEFAQRVKALKPGAILRDGGYVSTSLHRSTADESFSGEDGVVLKLLLPKGNRAYLMNGRGASSFAMEHEVMLPRGSRFRIRKVEGNVLTAEVL